MRSSYILNNYGPIFYHTVLAYIPRFCVEIGVLDGYSTLWIAKALKELKNRNHNAKLYSFDLFEDYKFNHGKKEEVEKMLIDQGVSDYVILEKKDFREVHKLYKEHSVDFLHVDISNDGEILHEVIENWHDILSFGGVLIFEGGSEERDNVEWMIKYNKKSIRKEIESNELIRKKYTFGTYEDFPSLTIFVKKG